MKCLQKATSAIYGYSLFLVAFPAVSRYFGRLHAGLAIPLHRIDRIFNLLLRGFGIVNGKERWT